MSCEKVIIGKFNNNSIESFINDSYNDLIKKEVLILKETVNGNEVIEFVDDWNFKANSLHKNTK